MCDGAGMAAPKGGPADGSCALKGAPQYYDTYWRSGSPGNITNQWKAACYKSHAISLKLQADRRGLTARADPPRAAGVVRVRVAPVELHVGRQRRRLAVLYRYMKRT